jgi:hypothetical protein
LADEIKQAADDHDADRAIELGRHLQELLKNGVAVNLTKERRLVLKGSAREKALNYVKDVSEKITEPLMTDLPQVMKDHPAALEEVMHLIKDAQSPFAGTEKAP